MSEIVREPTLYNTKTIVTTIKGTETLIPDVGGVPARPLSWQRGYLWSIKHRLCLAWGVFTGRYDALDWNGQK